MHICMYRVTVNMFLLLVVTVVILYISYVFLSKFAKSDAQKYVDEHVPGPPTVPIFGNALMFRNKSATEIFELQMGLVQKYGSIIKLWFGSQLTIILSDPDKLEILLSSHEHITKSPGYDGFKAWLGDGLIHSTGDHWRKHRKILTPAFHFKILEQFVQYFHTNSNVMIDILQNKLNEKSVDILHIVSNYYLDVISEAAMLTKINAQLNPKSEYLEAVKGYLRIYISRFFSFWKQFDFLFKLSQDYRDQQKYVHTLQSFTNDVIRKRKEERSQNGPDNTKSDDDIGIKRRVAFLDLLLDLQDKEGIITDEEIREEVDTFMFAGHDTVTSATTSCLYELSKNPEIQQRVVDESIPILGTDKNAEYTLNQLNELKYLDMVIKESLRLRAPVPFIERQVFKDIDLNGALIPEGTIIQIIPYAIQRIEKYFPNPEKFDPDRFLPENTVGRHPFIYLPFSAGPRNCIGQKYAMVSTKATVITILRNFELLPADPPFEPIFANSAVLESVNGIRVQLKRRNL